MAEPAESGKPAEPPPPPEPRRAGGLVLLLVLAGGLALTALVRWFWASGDPTADLVLQLKTAEHGGLSLAIPGEPAPLFSERPSYDRLTVELEPGAKEAFITATLDLQGNLGETEVHSLGFERVRFLRDGRGWKAPEGLAPVLTKVVAALCARRRALEAGKVPALAALAAQTEDQARADPALALLLAVRGRKYLVKGWYVRVERDAVTVSEDYRLTGATPERPVDEEKTRRLELRPDAHGEFYFARGLM
ncbi:MAG TPA: hypothetical protein VFA20_34120 [Myxococcaceae bacterium]|nr:hypothetical protein [Myxococcaceae bacterium]